MMTDFEYTRRVDLGKEYLFRRVVGKFTVEDEIDMIQYALDHGLIDEHIVGMVIDLNSATMDFGVGEGRRIMEYCGHDPILARLKFALVVDTADKIIHPLVGNMDVSQIKLRPFSTEEAAVHWMVI